MRTWHFIVPDGVTLDPFDVGPVDAYLRERLAGLDGVSVVPIRSLGDNPLVLMVVLLVQSTEDPRDLLAGFDWGASGA